MSRLCGWVSCVGELGCVVLVCCVDLWFGWLCLLGLFGLFRVGNNIFIQN